MGGWRRPTSGASSTGSTTSWSSGSWSDGCRIGGSKARAWPEAALARAGAILTELGLEQHPDKTKVGDLGDGRDGFDFLGCHFHARLSGRFLERGIRRYYLQRWPSQRAQKRLREKIRDRTGRNRCHADIRETIAEINPILRGWGTYFRTGNAAIVLNKLGGYVVSRLRGLLVKRYGRNLAAGRSRAWTRP